MKINLHKNFRNGEPGFSISVDLEIPDGKFIAVTGPSGAGKTSFLRMLAGLSKPDKGFLSIADTIWFDSANRIELTPQQRSTGFVFQDYALFPNMTVEQNLEFALSKSADKSIVKQLMDELELTEFSSRKPDSLSGGQKQRVAIGRALVRKPGLLLLDEPMAALDTELRLKTQELLLRLHKSYRLTTLLVTHDRSDIHKLADSVLVLKNGQVHQFGSPGEVFSGQTAHGFRLQAQLLRLQPIGEKVKAELLAGDQLLVLFFSENELLGLVPGDKVLLTMDEFQPAIEKFANPPASL